MLHTHTQKYNTNNHTHKGDSPNRGEITSETQFEE